MEREGYVSIWLGNFPDDSALMEYAAEDCVEYDEDDGSGIERPSQFSKDFFGGMIWAFDPDFWEREVVGSSSDIAELVSPFSYGDTFDVENIVLDRVYNAVILVYDYEYEPKANPANAPVEFIAAVPYENLDL